MIEDTQETNTDELDAVTAAEAVDDAADVEPRVYELSYLMVPAISEEQVPGEVGKLKELVAKHGGTVLSEEAAKPIPLAYTITRSTESRREKFDTAHFGSIKMEINPENVLQIKEVLDLNRNVLRYLIFKTVRENTRSDVKIQPQSRPERKTSGGQRVLLRKEEANVPVSEEALNKSIKDIVVE